MSVSTIRSTDPVNTDRPAEKAETPRPGAISNDVLRGVRVNLDVHLGDVSIAVEDMMALKTGSVVTLQTGLSDHVELYLNDTLVARGEIVAVGDKYGVRIAEIAPSP
jgi:flagellar motor switch protein FliN/FliY